MGDSDEKPACTVPDNLSRGQAKEEEEDEEEKKKEKEEEEEEEEEGR